MTKPTEDHLTLLRNACWRMSEMEFGAPEIDGKRPYGNSGVTRDLAELLPHLSEDERLDVHRELPGVLAYMCRTYTLPPEDDEQDDEQDETAAALDTVARHFVAHTYRTGREIAWEDYPDLSEADWDAVSARADEIVQSIERDEATYTAAYALLAARASDQEPQP